MADRFPAIEDIDEGTSTPGPSHHYLMLMQLVDPSTNNGVGENAQNDNADSSDFLARERAALGEDADQFGAPGINVQGDDDLLGGGDSAGATDEVRQFQSSFPAVDSGNERVAPGGTVTGSNRAVSPAPYTSEEEPQVIKEWRERRDLAIAAREEKAAARKEETIKEARTAIDEFYQNYNNKADKAREQTKKEAEEFLAKREDTTSGGTSWERIAKLVDLGKGGKAAAAPGKERFRELLGGLAKDSDAPGAKGY